MPSSGLCPHSKSHFHNRKPGSSVNAIDASVVAAIGHMTAADLRLSGHLYDPRRNLEEVRDKAFGARINTSE
jgi:hypothetical protein